MLRGLADGLTLFFLPFVLYALVLLGQRRFGLFGPQWTRGRMILLALAGLGFVVAGILLFGLLQPRGAGVFVPAHVDGGRLVPGTIR